MTASTLRTFRGRTRGSDTAMKQTRASKDRPKLSMSLCRPVDSEDELPVEEAPPEFMPLLELGPEG